MIAHFHEDQLRRLPKWAVRKIKMLQHRLSYHEDRWKAIEAGETNVVMDKFGVRPVHLPDDAEFSFHLPDGGRIDIRLMNDCVYVYCDENLTVFPNAAHSLNIKPVEERDTPCTT